MRICFLAILYISEAIMAMQLIKSCQDTIPWINSIFKSYFFSASSSMTLNLTIIECSKWKLHDPHDITQYIHWQTANVPGWTKNHKDWVKRQVL